MYSFLPLRFYKDSKSNVHNNLRALGVFLTGEAQAVLKSNSSSGHSSPSLHSSLACLVDGDDLACDGAAGLLPRLMYFSCVKATVEIRVWWRWPGGAALEWGCCWSLSWDREAMCLLSLCDVHTTKHVTHPKDTMTGS